MHADTVRNGWEAAVVQQAVCELIDIASGEARRPIAIFAHSMGNLILAAALDSRRCALPSASSWVAIGAPWRGSKAADRLGAICSGKEGGIHFAGSLLRGLAEREHFCEGAGGAPSPAYGSLRTEGNYGLDVLAARWENVPNASTCGTSPFGLLSIDSLPLTALAEFAGFGSAPNDGAVAAAGCRAAGGSSARWAEDVASPHYQADVNHFDLTCRHGENLLGLRPLGGVSQRPCSWIVSRAAAAATGSYI